MHCTSSRSACDPQLLPCLQFFSISVKAETGALAKEKRAFHLPRQGDLWEDRLMRAAGELSHFKNT